MNANYTPLTDSQWQKLEIFFRKTSTRGKKRQVSMRQVVNELLYVVRTGLQWRNLRSNIPWQTVYYYFRSYKHKLNDILQAIQNEHIQNETTAIDTQTVKISNFIHESKGIDGNKKINGRKRLIWVDTNGLLLNCYVGSADTHDGELGLEVLHRMSDKIKEVNADHPFGGIFKESAKLFNINVIVAQKPETSKGFVPQKGRWQVERSFAWLNHFRRLSKDYEKLPDSSAAFIVLAFLQMALNRFG
jgi:transposase